MKRLRHKICAQHGGGSVLVWGSLSAAGIGNLVFIDGNMDQHVYSIEYLYYTLLLLYFYI